MSRWKPDAAGRLVKAAMTLFDERGYEATTVAEIAESAGLTKRTFFRYFSDKREVLFMGSAQLQDHWATAVRNAPPDVGAIDAVKVGLDAVAELFSERHPLARIRARIIAANPELHERELIKLAKLADALADALRARGVADPAAELAAQTGVTIFHSAFGRWVRQDDPEALRRLMDESLADLRAVVAG
ncbi:TetR/AcrR family transcriptional regulator [Streptomyces sp. RPT161]|uniref:TetR/AcrR family transcriptional regulator n=1 Tax=Streptomyces sp. RPT161 TaxID=3015993 RepID=UPI0022B8D139|nr:TetR/AcrR family transcriptional regulator [Streptomyces sp. RPT161]